MCISFSLAYSSEKIVSGLIGQIYSPFGYTTLEITYCTVAAVICGVIGSIVFGTIMARRPIYKKLLIIDELCIFLVGIAMMFVLPVKNVILTAIMSGIFGFFLIAVVPIGFGFAS